MALIDTQTFPLTKQRVISALHLIPKAPDIFSGSKMREARVQFICGKNVLASVRGWLLATGVIDARGRSYYLTDFAKRVAAQDVELRQAGTWWCIHLNTCFSERSEPYRSFFCALGQAADWVDINDDFVSRLTVMVAKKEGNPLSESSIKTNVDGVTKVFRGSSPLTDLGLIEVRQDGASLAFRLSDAFPQDQIIVHALALARHRHFSTRTTVHFNELIEIGFNHFLCLSVNELRKRLREISRSQAFPNYLSFTEGKDLDSVIFGDYLHPKKTLLLVLQDAEDTWL